MNTNVTQKINLINLSHVTEDDQELPLFVPVPFAFWKNSGRDGCIVQWGWMNWEVKETIEEIVDYLRQI